MRSSMNSHQTEYLAIWNTAFTEFLGWSDAQTSEWAKPLLDNLGLPGMALNEPPLFYVARELACSQPYYDELSQLERWDFIRELQDVLAPLHARGFPDNYDFATARQAVRDLL